MPIINTIAPPSLEKIELEYDKSLFRAGLYGEPTVYKDNNGICHLYLCLYILNKVSFIEENQRTICVLPEGFRPSIQVALVGTFVGESKELSISWKTREPMFIRLDSEGNLIIFYSPEPYKSIEQIWIDATWVAE